MQFGLTIPSLINHSKKTGYEPKSTNPAPSLSLIASKQKY